MKRETTVYKIVNQEVRTTIIDGEQFVALADFCRCIEDAVGNFIQLTKAHEERLSFMNESLRRITEAVAEKDPGLIEELAQLLPKHKLN